MILSHRVTRFARGVPSWKLLIVQKCLSSLLHWTSLLGGDFENVQIGGKSTEWLDTGRIRLNQNDCLEPENEEL